MGQLIYGNGGPENYFADRTLTHLEIVIMGKLRRGESFGFCFERDISASGGQTTLWLAPPIPLQFVYLGRRDPSINRDWLDSLTDASNLTTGLRVVPEPSELMLV